MTFVAWDETSDASKPACADASPVNLINTGTGGSTPFSLLGRRPPPRSLVQERQAMRRP